VSVRVVSVQAPHLHATALVVALRGGPRYEGPRECGLTHFLEHMVFRGTEQLREPRALMAAFERLGEEPLAHTSDDEIVLSALVAPGRAGEAARLLASVLLRPAWRDLERERQLILEERLELVDEKGACVDVDDLSRRLAFAGHPMSRSVLGEERDIERTKRADLEHHRRRLVVSGNLVVALAGPVSARELASVRRAFAAVPAGAPPGETPAPLGGGPRFEHARLPGTPQVDVRLAFSGPGEKDERWLALRLLANVLDGGPTARLPVRLVDAGFAYAASAGLASYEDVSLLEVDVAVSRARFRAAFERALAVLASLRRGIEESEVARARERLLRRIDFARDDARGLAEWHARRALLGLSLDRDAVRAAIERLRARDVLAAARDVLTRERLATVLVGDLPRAEVRRAEARAACFGPVSTRRPRPTAARAMQ